MHSIFTLTKKYDDANPYVINRENNLGRQEITWLTMKFKLFYNICAIKT